MIVLRAGLAAIALGAVFAGLLASDGTAVDAPRPAWSEAKWPFPIDQWGGGRAFVCAAADCGVAITVYLRPKLGFCNCATGVADDAELDRVGDLELFSDRFAGIAEGRPITVGWMTGRSRAYRIDMRQGAPRTVLAIAFNDKCDVVVATVAAASEHLASAERAALEFLNGDLVLRWARAELGAS
jgi:hypothetical protein